MSFLVTFPDGYGTLCATREAAEKMLSYWGHIKPTIRASTRRRRTGRR